MTVVMKMEGELCSTAARTNLEVEVLLLSANIHGGGALPGLEQAEVLLLT